MNETNKVFLTFDYELFFGQSGTIDKCLLLSTEELLAILAKYNMLATFFVDATFLAFLKNQGLNSHLAKIENNIHLILGGGHRIELHIHPQWIDAVADDGKDTFTFKDYRYYSLNDCPKEVEENLFDDAFQTLDGICKRFDSRYEIKGYRAGGWCIDKFEKVKPLFEQYGLLFDSSVLPGLQKVGVIQSYDYSDILLDKSIYCFDNDVHETLLQGRFFEVPITIYKAGINVKYARIISRRFHTEKLIPFGDGKSIDQNNGDFKKNWKFYFDKLFSSQYEMCSIDGYCNTSNLVKIACKREFTTIVGHPKSLTLKSMETLEELGKQNLCFTTIYDYLTK